MGTSLVLWYRSSIVLHGSWRSTGYSCTAVIQGHTCTGEVQGYMGTRVLHMCRGTGVENGYNGYCSRTGVKGILTGYRGTVVLQGFICCTGLHA
jgi:hypothetical protein